MKKYDVLYDYEMIANATDTGKDLSYEFSDKDFDTAKNSMRKNVADFNKGLNIQILENGDVIMDVEIDDCINKYKLFNFRINEQPQPPVMHYGIYYDSEHYCDCMVKCETFKEVKEKLEYFAELEWESKIDSEKIEWDEDKLGFIIESGDYLTCRTYRIYEIDEDGNWIDDEM